MQMDNLPARDGSVRVEYYSDLDHAYTALVMLPCEDECWRKIRLSLFSNHVSPRQRPEAACFEYKVYKYYCFFIKGINTQCA